MHKMVFSEIKKKRFDKSQYEILIRCSEKGDLKAWNNRRKSMKEAPILLEGADLDGVDLPGADLSNADLLGAELCNANLRGAAFRCANLTGANLSEADLEGANLQKANLVAAELSRANLRGAHLFEANLKNAELMWANLEGADLTKANLNDADLWRANLKGARLVEVIANARTFVWRCDFNTQTDLMGVELIQGRIDPRLKERLKKPRTKIWNLSTST
jgi:uncharacterized protein YjbI with pentapeptide repeats